MMRRLADKGGKGAAAAMKPLTADEIVRQRDKARARAAGAAGLPGRAAPPKAARFLDAASLLDAARERRPAGTPGKTPFPPARQGNSGFRGSLGPGACAAAQRYLDLRGPQQQQQQRRPGSGRELAAVVAWAQPPRLRMPPAEEGSGPAAGEESREAPEQRARNQALVRPAACCLFWRCCTVQPPAAQPLHASCRSWEG
jgi:hypothetical protein